MENDNAEGCEDFFWFDPINNVDEIVGLSEQTSWRVKGRYVAEPSNKPSSGTKDICNDPIFTSKNFVFKTLLRKH